MSNCVYIWLCDGGLAVERDYVVDMSGKLGRMVCEVNTTIFEDFKMEINKRIFISPALILLNYIATLWILLACGIEQVGVRPFLPYLICQMYIVIIGMPTEQVENHFQKICIWSLLLIAVHVLAGLSGVFFVAESFGSAIEWLTLLLLSDLMVTLFLFLPLTFLLFYVKKKR